MRQASPLGLGILPLVDELVREHGHVAEFLDVIQAAAVGDKVVGAPLVAAYGADHYRRQGVARQRGDDALLALDICQLHGFHGCGGGVLSDSPASEFVHSARFHMCCVARSAEQMCVRSVQKFEQR